MSDMDSLMKMPRLTVEEKFVNAGFNKDNLTTPSGKFTRVIGELMTRNPLWSFVVSDIRQYNKQVQTVRVYQHGEELGYIEWDYFRGDYGFEIGNDRIKQARERTRAYRTHDEKKALAAIKKTFSPKNMGERLEKAEGEVTSLLNNQHFKKQRAYNSAGNTLEKYMIAYVEAMKPQFREHMVSNGHAHIIEAAEVAEMEMKTLDELSKAFGDGKASLILKADGQYIVKTGDKVEILDDTTLPEHMKAKLGMLKLVEDEHFITNIGGRVNAEVFVLAPNDEGEMK